MSSQTNNFNLNGNFLKGNNWALLIDWDISVHFEERTSIFRITKSLQRSFLQKILPWAFSHNTSNNQKLGSAFDEFDPRLSFAKLVMMSSAPTKSAGDARYAFQDPFIR